MNFSKPPMPITHIRPSRLWGSPVGAPHTAHGTRRGSASDYRTTLHGAENPGATRSYILSPNVLSKERRVKAIWFNILSLKHVWESTDLNFHLMYNFFKGVCYYRAKGSEKFWYITVPLSASKGLLFQEKKEEVNKGRKDNCSLKKGCLGKGKGFKFRAPAAN